jgi:regulator of replication initiation timing
MSSVTHGSSNGQSSERPERSRNAKAQARHRAKRKAYIEQLEQTVTKLQTALGLSPEQVAALPPPLMKIRELEQENARLHRENEEMRRMLGETGGRSNPTQVDMGRRNSFSSIQDGRHPDRDFKRRKMASNGDEMYMTSGDTSQVSDMLPRPPPLTIPSPLHHYGGVPSQHPSNHNGAGSASLFGLHAPAFQMPNTPSGSSSNSSPPFSASIISLLSSKQTPVGIARESFFGS